MKCKAAFPPLCFMLVLLMALTTTCRRQNAVPSSTKDTAQVTAKDSIAADSLEFRRKHHYTENYNFKVCTDSLFLQVQIPEEAVNNMPLDTFHVKNGEILAVADIRIMPKDTYDSVWVQLALNDNEIGWVHEKDMLENVVPDDSISRFIYFFSNKHYPIFLIVFFVVIFAYALRKRFSGRAHIVHFKDIATFYPTMLTITVACSATFYSSIQMFAPDQWQEYYYHPSLNPFTQHLPLALFLTSVWMIIIMAIATIDDSLRHLSVGEAIPYLLGVAAMCALNYVIFTYSTLYYVGYLLLMVYVGWAIYRYLFKTRSRYICGNCGRQIKKKGRCPYCGVINE